MELKKPKYHFQFAQYRGTVNKRYHFIDVHTGQVCSMSVIRFWTGTNYYGA